jgi:hypothetical protein
MNRCTDWQKLASLGPEMRILPKTKVNECNRDFAPIDKTARPVVTVIPVTELPFVLAFRQSYTTESRLCGTGSAV